MILFILGILVGLVLSLTIYVFEAKAKLDIYKRIDEHVAYSKQESGAVFLPPTDVEAAQDFIRSQNALRGEGTRLSDL